MENIPCTPRQVDPRGASPALRGSGIRSEVQGYEVTEDDHRPPAVALAGDSDPDVVWRDGQPAVISSRIRRAVSLGVLPTCTPTASSASFLACAVPDEPDTIAPAWPMVLPSGAVNPAT